MSNDEIDYLQVVHNYVTNDGEREMDDISEVFDGNTYAEHADSIEKIYSMRAVAGYDRAALLTALNEYSDETYCRFIEFEKMR